MGGFREIVHIPRSVMIGSTGRNTGKTEFACAMIRALSERHRVHAVKVTTIYETGGACIHGDTGCGVCTSMDRPCVLEEAHDADGGKDTSRMLLAGAERVWWLRVREDSLPDAVQEIARLVPAYGALVIESNGARRVVEPDLFFMLGDPNRRGAKKSAAAVMSNVDALVGFDGRTFTMEPSAVDLSCGRFTFPREAGAVVLAGGHSSRMGSDKRLLDINGVPLVEHVYEQIRGMFGEVMVSLADAPLGSLPEARHIVDCYGVVGPIGGVASALEASAYDINFVTACDIPDVPLGLVATMLRRARDHQVVVPVDSAGRYQSLFAIYNRSVLPNLQRLIESGEHRIRMLYDQVDTCRIAIPSGVDLRNLNTRAEYLAYLAG